MDQNQRKQKPNTQQPIDKRPVTLKTLLKDIINANKTGAARLNKIVSFETQAIREEILFQGFTQLKMLGFHLHDPSNFRPKHMKALAQFWCNQGLSPSTIQNRISIFRVFCSWVGKGDMIGDSADYVVDKDRVKRVYAAKEDKSWSARAIDFNGILDTVLLEEPRVALYILLGLNFGLRLRESYMLKPHRADKDMYVALAEGTKGDRARTVPIESEDQKAVIELAKQFANGINGHIGIPGKTLKQSKDRIKYVLQKCGVTLKDMDATFHGLRHQFANEFYERRSGVDSPVRGGPNISGEVDELARLQTSEALGHSRKSITSAYLGGIMRSIQLKAKADRQESEGEGVCG